ncbi:MAG: GLUG motif-containing protein [Planctomycetota bacterium]|jgi:hypothetical protein
MTADIDLDPNLPGRKVFDRAVIASETNDARDPFGPPLFDGTPFTGVFDGNRHTISHMTITGKSYLALFGRLVHGAEVFNLGLEAVDVNGTGHSIGGLVGSNGQWDSGGGILTNCYSTGSIIGERLVGGLVGHNSLGGNITNCYSTGSVSGDYSVGGLVGGGGDLGRITSSFWDVETSKLLRSAGGIGKTTAEMKVAATFLDAGWDFVDETTNGTEDIWWILEGQDYPRLWWELIPQN